MEICVATTIYLPPQRDPVKVDVKELDHVVRAPLWIGYISIRVGAQEVLGEPFDDNLHELWLTLLSQVGRLIEKGQSRGVLPGNDGTTVELVRKGGSVIISTICGPHRVAYQANLMMFVKTLVSAYLDFAAASIRYSALCPGNAIVESTAEAEKIILWLDRTSPAFDE